jgi:hypothetical protein
MSASKLKVDTLNNFNCEVDAAEDLFSCAAVLFHRFGREIYLHPVYFAFRFIKDMKRNFQTRFY